MRRNAVLVVTAISGVILIAAVLTLNAFLRYRAGASRAGKANAPSQVWIDSPVAESTFRTDDLIWVKGSALGTGPFLRAELWINGEHAGQVDFPNGGVHPLSTEFSWSPSKPGFYSLVLRAVDANAIAASSPALVVLVEPDGNYLNRPEDYVSEGGSAIDGSVFPAAARNGVTHTQPPASIPPAETWEGSMGNWLNSLSLEAPPEAPNLEVEVEGCSARLKIEDLATNEEGFNVYRQSLTSPVWSKIKTLASHAGEGWISYMDPGQVGGVTYYVSSFNGKGEASSPLQSVSFNPQECEGSDAAGQAVSLEVTELRSDIQADRVYCYRSFNGLDWSRWPTSGFFAPGATGYALTERMISFVKSGVLGDGENEVLQFQLDCWGWAGGALQFLGKLGIDGLDLENLETYSLEGGEIKAEVAIHAAPTLSHPTFRLENRDDLRDVTFKLMHSTIDLSAIGSAAVLPDETIPSAQRFPYIQAWLTYRKEECFDHLEPESQVAFATLFLCSALEGYTEGPGTLNPQPYIIWKFYQTCPAGSYDTCLDINWWKQWIEEKQREAYVEIWAENSYRNWQFFHDEVDRTVHRVSQYTRGKGRLNITQLLPACEGDTKFKVRIVINRGNDTEGPTAAIENITSRWSNWVYGVRCREPIGEQVLVEVALSSIAFNHVDDDDLEDPQEIETYGGIHAGTPKDLGIEPYGLEWGNQRDFECTNVRCVEPVAPIIVFQDGAYNMENYELCQRVVNAQCDPTGYSWPDSYPWKTNNNKMVIPVRGGENIHFTVSIRDMDTSSPNDTVCSVQGSTSTRTLDAWASLAGEVVQLHQPDNGNAECTVTLALRAVNP